MTEAILIGLLFAGALFYLGRKLYRSMKADQGCAKGCGCSQADVSKAPRNPAIR